LTPIDRWKIFSDIGLTEPVLRDAILLSIDLRAVKASEISMLKTFSNPTALLEKKFALIAKVWRYLAIK